MPRILALDEGPHGLSWTLDEPMQRTSHALAIDGRVWLVDPVDIPEALERVAGLGEPAGVLQLLDRHNRDCAALAERLGVPHLRLPETVPGTPLEVVTVVSLPGWRELALWWPDPRVLVVSEAVGTGPMFRTPDGPPADVHSMLRLRPPGALKRFEPAHLLVGHGANVHADAADALHGAYEGTARRLPGLLKRLPKLAKR